MPMDYPAFQKPFWPIRDWASLGEMSKNIWWVPTEPVNPRETIYQNIYSVPFGRKFYWLEDHIMTEVKLYGVGYLVGISQLASVWINAYEHLSTVYAVPLLVYYGMTIGIEVTNMDIVPGRGFYGMAGFETPASEPEKPKSDDPIELLRTGEFTFCYIISLKDGEEVRIFSKLRDKEKNYLRVKNLYKPDQKVISQFKIKPEEANEIIETSRREPEKIKMLLEKYEKKYLKKK
jgi:hypothetical protein